MAREEVRRSTAGPGVWGSKEETWGLQDYSTDDKPVRTVDPVCGMTIDEDKAAAKIGYAGDMFYFCSKHCEEEFRENPAEFIGQRQEP